MTTYPHNDPPQPAGLHWSNGQIFDQNNVPVVVITKKLYWEMFDLAHKGAEYDRATTAAKSVSQKLRAELAEMVIERDWWRLCQQRAQKLANERLERLEDVRSALDAHGTGHESAGYDLWNDVHAAWLPEDE